MPPSPPPLLFAFSLFFFFFFIGRGSDWKSLWDWWIAMSSVNPSVAIFGFYKCRIFCSKPLLACSSSGIWWTREVGSVFESLVVPVHVICLSPLQGNLHRLILITSHKSLPHLARHGWVFLICGSVFWVPPWQTWQKVSLNKLLDEDSEFEVERMSI